MEIFPAIDIINGEVVRLTEGDYSTAKKYKISPVEAAQKFYDDGAKNIHIVDLDGAKSGNADNAKTIKQIAKKFDIFIEVGGGIRTEVQIKKYLDSGVKRVILGTVAVKNFSFVEQMISKFGNAISVGVDALNEKVAINGWREVTEINSLDFCKKLKSIGVNHVIYTDISKDGSLKGTNLTVYRVLCQTEYPKITASGGITYLNELKELKNFGMYGAILGKALYENKLNLRESIKVSQGEG